MRPARAAFGLALGLLPGAVCAHSPIKGLDNFYAGLLHPLFVPAHLLAALALGILFGQRGPRELQTAVVAYLIALATGLAAAALNLTLPVETALLAAAGLTGALVALDLKLPLGAHVSLASLVGLMIGIDSAQAGLSGRGLLAALLGTAVAAYLLALYAMVFAEFFGRRPWQRVGLRVFGSWAAASALLVLTLSFAR